MQGLFRRGGVWQARLVVPLRLRSAVGKRELVRSTGCHELGAAKVVHARLFAQWRSYLFTLDGGRVNDDQILQLAHGSPRLLSAGYVSVADAVEATGLGSGDLLQAVADRRMQLWCRLPASASTGVRASLDDVEANQCLPNPDSAWATDTEAPSEALRVFEDHGVANDMIARDAKTHRVLSVLLPTGDVFIPHQAPELNVQALLLPAHQVESLRQDWLTKVTPERLAAATSPRPVVAAPPPATGSDWAAKPLSDAVSIYLSSPDGLPERTSLEKEIAQHRLTLQRLGEHCGNKPLREFADDDLRSFRDWTRTWPAGNIPKRLQRPSWPETINAADAESWPKMSLEERLNWVRQFFKWLHRRGRLHREIGRTLAGSTGISKADRIAAARAAAAAAHERGDAKTKRSIFDADALNKVFTQPQFATGNGRHARGAATCNPHEYWAPILAYLHGLRLREVSQLSLNDVRAVDGIWCFDINGREADRRVKNSRGEGAVVDRIVPLHPLAIDLGLLEYADALRTAGFRRLFPELPYRNDDDTYSREPGRKFTEAMKKLGYPRDGTLTFHSFRHTANDDFGRVKLPLMDDGLRFCVRIRLLGHSLPPGDTNSEHYTHVTTADMQALVASREIDRLPSIAKFDIPWGIDAVRATLRRKQSERGKEDNGPIDTRQPCHL